jgi:hypothetical protein
VRASTSIVETGSEDHHTLVAEQERRLVGGIGDPEQVSLDAPDVQPLLVQSGPQCGGSQGNVARRRRSPFRARGAGRHISSLVNGMPSECLASFRLR